MVGDGRDLARRGQHLIEMTLPSGRIGPWWPVPPHDGPVEDLLNAVAGAVSGDRFAGSIARKMSGVSMLATSMPPSTGKAKAASELKNCSRCLALRHFASC
jgi:hypothetical protein